MGDEPVLLIEDEDRLRTALAAALRRHGVVTVEAGSAEEADDRLAAGLRPRLVLLDLNLPGRSGWDLLRGSLAPGPTRPPVIVITALTVGAGRLQEAGIDGYLPKPFALATFVETVKRYLAAPPEAPDGR
jgi:DNA-binding response OmpR family regulator